MVILILNNIIFWAKEGNYPTTKTWGNNYPAWITASILRALDFCFPKESFGPPLRQSSQLSPRKRFNVGRTTAKVLLVMVMGAAVVIMMLATLKMLADAMASNDCLDYEVDDNDDGGGAEDDDEDGKEE